MGGVLWGRLVAASFAAVLLAGCGGGASVVAQPKAPTTGPLGDTWTWDGSTWAMAAGASPSARFTSAMAYDEAHRVTILFGGSALLDQFADTWSWDGARWTRLQPVHHPISLSGHVMAYDAARHQVVLYGGAHGLYEKANYLNDTWTWNGSDWTLASSVGPTSLQGQQLAFDPSSGNLVLFGGRNGNTTYSDETWVWDGAHWTRSQPSDRPPARGGDVLAYDAARKALLLFGGAVLKPDVGPGEAGLPQADVWSYSMGGWTELRPASTPPARANSVMAADLVKSRLLLFSGTSCPFRNETWAWDGAAWSLLHPSSSPSARAFATIAADLSRKRVVLFGGLADTPCI